MRRVIEAALLLVLFGAVHGSPNQLARNHFKNIRDFHRDKVIAKRQSSCTPLLDDYPESCTIEVESIDDIFALYSPENLPTLLNEYCTPECVQPLVDYYNCLGLSELATFYNNLVCGKNGNQYCLVLLSEDNTIASDISCVPPGGTCTESCATTQETVVDEWGCCAASYYAYLGATCAVDAGDVCDGVIDDGASDAGIINRVGIGLIMVFAMLAASANAVLF